MIERNEIDQMADALTVRPTDVERDYVNGWLLAGVYGASDLGQHLVLKGGNALRKGYFPNTRYSKDLDFTAPTGIDRDLLSKEMKRVTDYVSAQTGVRFLDDRFQIVEPPRATGDIELIEVRAYFLDFYGQRQTLPIRVYMDITEFDKIVLPVRDCKLIHPYSDTLPAPPTLRCVAVEEILASKLKCLLQRRKVSDLFDYLRWLIFDDVQLDRTEILRVFLRKTIYSRAPGAAFELLVNLPIAVFQELWNQHITTPSTCRFDLSVAFERFKTHLKEMFGQYASALFYRLSFFPSGLREPILNAGRSQHLMSMTYDSQARIIEPYALKYRIKRDGVGREYFYAYDRSGGNSGTQSIKSFLAEKVSALEELQESFEPRYEIELGQAGDLPDDPFFRGRARTFVPGFGITRQVRPRRRSHSSYRQPKYHFSCPVCHKSFPRSSYDQDISGHKHPNGYQCPGSFGVYKDYS
jgi:predicted nucleotidyltransferase component of viral defense system